MVDVLPSELLDLTSFGISKQRVVDERQESEGKDDYGRRQSSDNPNQQVQDAPEKGTTDQQAPKGEALGHRVDRRQFPGGGVPGGRGRQGFQPANQPGPQPGLPPFPPPNQPGPAGLPPFPPPNQPGPAGLPPFPPPNQPGRLAPFPARPGPLAPLPPPNAFPPAAVPSTVTLTLRPAPSSSVVLTTIINPPQIVSTTIINPIETVTAFATFVSTEVITLGSTILVPTTETATLISTVVSIPPQPIPSSTSTSLESSSPVSLTTAAVTSTADSSSILTSSSSSTELTLPPVGPPIVPESLSSLVPSSTAVFPSTLTSSADALLSTLTTSTDAFSSTLSSTITASPAGSSTSSTLLPTSGGISSARLPASIPKTDTALIASVSSAVGILFIGVVFLCCVRRRSKGRSSVSPRSIDEEGSRSRVFSVAELADTDRKVPEVQQTSLEPVVNKPKDAPIPSNTRGSNGISPIVSVATAEPSATELAAAQRNGTSRSLFPTNTRTSEYGRFRFSGFPARTVPHRPDTLVSAASTIAHESVLEYPIYLAEEGPDSAHKTEERRSIQSAPAGPLSPAPRAFQFHKKYNVNVSIPEHSQAPNLSTVMTAPATPTAAFAPLHRTSTMRSSATLVPGSQYPGHAATKGDRCSMAESVDEEELDLLVRKIAPLTPSVVGSSSEASQSLYGGPKSQLRDHMPSPTETASQKSAAIDHVMSQEADSPTISSHMPRSAGMGSVEAQRESLASVPRYRDMGSWVSDQGRWIKGREDFEPPAS